MKTFRAYLDKEKVTYTDADIAANLSWIKREIRKEALISVFGLTEGYKVELEDDVQLQKAVETLPQARALYENARKVIATDNLRFLAGPFGLGAPAIVNHIRSLGGERERADPHLTGNARITSLTGQAP